MKSTAKKVQNVPIVVHDTENNEHEAELKKYDFPIRDIKTIISLNLYQNLLIYPYQTALKNGLDFPATDKLAHAQGNYDEDDLRIAMLLRYLIGMAESTGSTLFKIGEIVRMLNYYQHKNEYTPSDFNSAVIIPSLLEKDFFYVDFCSADIAECTIQLSETREKEISLSAAIKRFAVMEKESSKATQPGYATENEFPYDTNQIATIESAASSGLKIITGYPGTGKTAVINGIIEYALQLNPNIRIDLIAPTGRAAKHLSEITGKPATTIHHALGLNPFFDQDYIYPLYCDMLICDEASMLSLDLAEKLFHAIVNQNTTVYLVGDVDQLSAVGAGNVLKDIIASGLAAVYKLIKVYRQDGTILENARKVNCGKHDLEQNETFTIQRFNDNKALCDEIVKLHNQYYDINEYWETQVLIPSYKTECGIIAVNKRIQQFNSNPIVFSCGGTYSYKTGDKIIMLKNDEAGRYKNGSIGVFLRDEKGRAVVEIDGKEVRITSKASREDMALGYAVSVHKAQGSEFKHTIVCMPGEPKALLKRNVLYTAITRAKQDLHLLEIGGSVDVAIENNSTERVRTGLISCLASSSII